MAKTKVEFVCTNCGATHYQWAGQCSECKEWNILEEVLVTLSKASRSESLRNLPPSKVQSLNEVKTQVNTRLSTGLSELDRTLGGGLVEGSVVLIGGDPGIGKSTLILQALAFINRSEDTLYVSGEESAQQISDRAARLGIDADVQLLSETYLEKILKTAKKTEPESHCY